MSSLAHRLRKTDLDSRAAFLNCLVVADVNRVVGLEQKDYLKAFFAESVSEIKFASRKTHVNACKYCLVFGVTQWWALEIFFKYGSQGSLG